MIHQHNISATITRLGNGLGQPRGIRPLASLTYAVRVYGEALYVIAPFKAFSRP